MELHVPPDVPAVEYAGEVHVMWDGGRGEGPRHAHRVAVHAPVHASLKSAFGLYYGALPTVHGVSGDAFSALRAR